MIGNKISPFKFWCQKVLPTVYDDSLSYYEVLNKVTEFLNEVITQMNTLTENVENYETELTAEWEQYKTELTAAWNEYKTYIDNYFDNLDVQEEINNKLDAMALDGTLTSLVMPFFNTYKAEIDAVVNTQNEAITTLEARVDEITTLPEGSTTGDAELADIRIGYNGYTYTNAGNAVREQFANLLETIDNSTLGNNQYYKLTDWNGTRWNINRFYILRDFVPNVGIKTLKLNRCGTSTQHLFLLTKGTTTYQIVKEYTATPVDGVAVFNDIITNGKYLIGFQSDTGIYTNMTGRYVLPYLQGWASDLTISTFTEVDSVGVDVEIVEFACEINPDIYVGTDAQKLQQAFDALTNTGGIISINRKYTVDTTIQVKHIYSANHRIIVKGTNYSSEINISAYNVYFEGTAGNTGGVVFKDLKLTGINTGKLINPGTGEITDVDHKALVGVIIDNCAISGFRYIVQGVHYLQSFWIINSVIRNIETGINTGGHVLYNLLIENNVVEGIHTLVRLYLAEGANIVNNVIEGCSLIPITFGSQSMSTRIEGNYFEANDITGGTGISIDLSGLPVDRPRNVAIKSNYFHVTENKNAIKIPSTTNTGDGTDSAMLIVNNSILGDGYMITGEDNIERHDVVCALNSGRITTLTNSIKVIGAVDILNLFN